MLDALRTRGYHGVGLNELLTVARAPKGVLYHHFPGGKAELAVCAIESVVAKLCADLDKTLQRAGDPVQALGAWMTQAQRVLAGSGFASGCPLATIALESTPEDEAIRAALADGFSAIRTRLANALAGAGMAHEQARGAAALIVSAYEGALVQARVAGNVRAMSDASEALVGLLRLALGGRSTPNA
ncbi:MAG: TetR/AcrR family transcriptional regulator [Gammaproteobacteria bacterium]|nr:TetR/AcrR family transcriptional regulator [Gammaproteobacteria bacterium]